MQLLHAANAQANELPDLMDAREPINNIYKVARKISLGWPTVRLRLASSFICDVVTCYHGITNECNIQNYI